MRVTPTILRRIEFYLRGNQRLNSFEECHSLSEAMSILEKTLSGEIEELEIRTDGALEKMPLPMDKNPLIKQKKPLELLREYIRTKITDSSGSFTRCKHELYFNPFRTRSTRTHYIEIVHGILPEKDSEPKIPYEGILIRFKTKG